MSIIIDSVTLNAECLETPPSSARTDRCVAEAQFHTRSGEGRGAEAESITERIPFQREGDHSQVSFYVSAGTIPSTLSTLLTENRFDPSAAELQRDLRNILNVQDRYRAGRRMITDLEPGPDLGHLFDDLVNYMFLGEIDSPDSVQQAANRSLFMRLARLSPAAEEKFRIIIDSLLFDNREWLNREDAAGIPRLERSASVLNFSHRIQEATQNFTVDSALTLRLREFEGNLIAYLFSGEPAFSDITTSLNSLAGEVYRTAEPNSTEGEESEAERINLYEVLLPALRAFEDRPPFQAEEDPRTRLQLLTRFVGQPAHTRVLEYSVLEAREALERSILDPLLESPQTEALLERVGDQIEAPDLDAGWLHENGNLREIVHAFVQAIEVRGAGDHAQLEMEVTELRHSLERLFSSQVVNHREFIGGTLALLRTLMRDETLRVYWEGELRELRFNFGADDRARLRSLDQWMAHQIQRSLVETDLILPIVEGVVCAAGIGLAIGGSVDDSLSPDLRLGLQVGGGGGTGLGCGALASHFIFDTGNPYISDLIGGGVGALLGVGIPLLLHFLLGGTSTPMIPIDGRNPVMDYGP